MMSLFGLINVKPDQMQKTAAEAYINQHEDSENEKSEEEEEEEMDVDKICSIFSIGHLFEAKLIIWPKPPF